ncbi:MAG: peptidoglycan DD-metalloendopeptidase family protein [Pseudomonadota bacterium]|nr:peptidoglycan DD-metalloendopeptidase family protein [Pseudomonadota bacterium]
MILRLAPVWLALAALALAPGPLLAASEEKLQQQKLQKVESELGQHKQEAAALAAREQEANQNLKQLRQKLITATEALQTKAADEELLREKLGDLAHDIDEKKAALSVERTKLNTMMEAFIELSRQPPESLFFHTQLTTDHIHRAILLRAVVPRLRQEAMSIGTDLHDLGDERQQMTKQQRLLAATQSNMEAQRHNLDQLISMRQGMLDRTEAQKEAIAAKLVSLTTEARDLRQLLEEVTPKHQTKGVPHALRGTLKWPVVGAVLRGFGTKDADGVTSEGLTFAAPSGSPVVAPDAGRVVFAGPFKGYGRILILEHEGGYHSFLAGFGRIDADMGQDVDAGEPLGVLPVKDSGRPELYFEWRHNDEPVDPGVRSPH